jgi:P pilus assembly chaperone PapD
MAMGLSVPVLIEPPGAPKPPLSWRAQREAGGQITFMASNSGQRPARVAEASIRLQDGTTVAIHPVAQNPYILPGAERRWRPLQNAAGRLTIGAAVRLIAATQSGPMEQTITLP